MPAQSPTLSPTLSAMVAALRGSSSGMPGLHLAHQVGADVGRLGEDAAADPHEQGQERGAEGEADQHRRGRVLEDEDDGRGAEQAEAHAEHAGDGAGAEGHPQGAGHPAALGGRGRRAHVAPDGDAHADEAGQAGEGGAEEEADDPVEAVLKQSGPSLRGTWFGSCFATDSASGPVSCATLPAAGLAPGASVTCSAGATYTVTQADVDRGSVSDTATATGTTAAGVTSPVSAPSTVTVPTVAPAPGVSIDKTGTLSPASDQGAAQVGDTIAYSYVVTNTGNVTLASVSVDDPTLGPVNCPAPAAPGLALGASETCTGNSIQGCPGQRRQRERDRHRHRHRDRHHAGT